MITDTESLREITEAAQAAGCCAVDTEFVWERTYYAILGVVQIGLPDGRCELVDAPAIEDWTPFAKLIADPDTVKILHDAQQDLKILKRACGALPRNIFDSQRAAGFVGLSATISLSDLLRKIVKVRLDKAETRSDWLQRPLTDEQERYAEDDVRYLPEVREKILRTAEQKGRAAWIEEEMKLYENAELYAEGDPDAEMPRVRGTGSANAEQRDIIRALAGWRELEARRRNLPRPFVLSDDAIVSLSKRPPRSMEAIEPVKGLSPKALNHTRKPIWKALQRAFNNELPPLPTGKRRGRQPDESFEARVDLALAFVKGRCLANELDPALIGNRAEITAFVQEADAALEEDHNILRGWRFPLIGAPLLTILDSRASIMIDPSNGCPALSEGHELSSAVAPAKH